MNDKEKINLHDAAMRTGKGYGDLLGATVRDVMAAIKAQSNSTTYQGNEMFYKTYAKWYNNQNVHTRMIVARLFDKNFKLYISNSKRRVVNQP